MKRIIQTLFALALVTTLAGAATANACTARIDGRRVVQHQRIRQGVRSGELTRGEAYRLRAGQQHIRGAERRAKADGFVGMRERARLNHMQNRQSRQIYRLKHNGRSI